MLALPQVVCYSSMSYAAAACGTTALAAHQVSPAACWHACSAAAALPRASRVVTTSMPHGLRAWPRDEQTGHYDLGWEAPPCPPSMTNAVARPQVVMQVFFFFCNIGDSISNTAQAFLPDLFSRRDRVGARTAIKNIVLVGSLIGEIPCSLLPHLCAFIDAGAAAWLTGQGGQGWRMVS